jgi:hypothetical protein
VKADGRLRDADVRLTPDDYHRPASGRAHAQSAPHRSRLNYTPDART